MNEPFNIQALVEKLSKLNNSQQSIETLSSWCVYHRKKAKQIVETWDQVFSNTPKEQKVPFLYLANDILQNSRRKGSEFVNEFWKVLPACLKNVYENGEDNGKKVVNRLVEIWDERKVFGSRGQGLKDEVLGSVPTALDDGKSSDHLDNGKSSNPIKLVRKDANTIRIKLAVGGMPEKIVTAYQSVLDENFNEDTALNKFENAIEVLEKIQKDADDACAEGKQESAQLMSNLQEQESVLNQCIQQLGSIKAIRLALVTQLKEALQEQESKLEHVDNQLQVAQSQIQNASHIKHKLRSAMTSNGVSPSLSLPLSNLVSEATTIIAEFNQTPNSIIPPLQPMQPLTTFASTLNSVDEEHKKAAAAVAAKLTASTSSAQVLTSILSSLAAEEAASKNNGLSSGVLSGSPTSFPAEKRPRLEKPMSISETSTTSYFGQTPQQPQHQGISLAAPQVSAGNMQPMPQSNNQALPTFIPPLPPLPPPPLQQFVPTGGAMMGVPPFGFMNNPLPPPPPLSSLGMTRPGPTPPFPPPPLPAQQQQQQQTQQLQSTSMGFYQPPIGFYGQ